MCGGGYIANRISSWQVNTLIFKNDTELSEFEKKLKLRCCDLRLLEQVYSEYAER